MNQHRQRYVTGVDGESGGVELQAGLETAIELGQSAGCLLITFSTKHNLVNVRGILESKLGTKCVALLEKNGAARIRFDIAIVTDRTATQLYSWHGPVLMVYPTDRMLNQVGSMAEVTAEIVVPWHSGQAEKWICARIPTPLGSASSSDVPSALKLPQVVEHALRGLDAFVNPVNCLCTKSDREQAIQVFETLQHYHPELEANSVHAYLVGVLDWDGEMADSAHEIYRELQAGKRLRGRKGPDAQLYEYWTSQSVDGTD